MYAQTSPLTPEGVLSADELALYQGPDFLQAGGLALAEFYTKRMAAQQDWQRRLEAARNDCARTVGRSSETSAAYTTINALLSQSTNAAITFRQASGYDVAGRPTSSIAGNGLETRKRYDGEPLCANISETPFRR